MNFWPALLGALLGGILAITGGYLADRRRTQQNVTDTVRDQMAELISHASMVANHIAKYQQRQAQHDQASQAARIRSDQAETVRLNAEPIELDETALNDHIRYVVRASAELNWLTYRSPMRSLLIEFTTQTEALIGSWSGGYQEWLTLHEQYMSQLAGLDSAMIYVSSLPGRHRAWYWQAINLPTPPPLGVRLESTRAQTECQRLVRWAGRNKNDGESAQ